MLALLKGKAEKPMALEFSLNNDEVQMLVTNLTQKGAEHTRRHEKERSRTVKEDAIMWQRERVKGPRRLVYREEIEKQKGAWCAKETARKRGRAASAHLHVQRQENEGADLDRQHPQYSTEAQYGVYWGRSNLSNISFAVKGQAQTNQRAELGAILSAIRTIRDATQQNGQLEAARRRINCAIPLQRTTHGSVKICMLQDK